MSGYRMEAQVKDKQIDFLTHWKKVNSIIAMVGTLLILIGLPLVFQDYYFNLLDVKYYYYCSFFFFKLFFFTHILL